MAETVLLDGSNYEFEIFIVNFTENKQYEVVPISKSSIKYLEVTNDLVNIGYIGRVIFTNFYNLLQKLRLFTSTSAEAPYMYIYFKNLDFNATKAGSKEIFLTASLQKGQELNVNSIDSNLYFEFEELSISRLKRTKVNYLDENVSVSLRNGTYTPITLIKKFFEDGISESKIMDGTISTAETEIKGAENKSSKNALDVTAITNLSNQDTYYSIIEKLYSYVSFESNIAGWYSPGLMQLENDTKKGRRKLVISSLLDTTRTFFNKVKSNSTDEDMPNYLMEKFNIAQTGDAPYFSDNYLEKYELKRVNYDDVFENKWTTIELICESVSCDDLYQINYTDLRSAFEHMGTNPFASNLPDRRDDVIVKKEKEIQYSRPGLDGLLAQVYGTNKIFKSFIFDNLAITFRTKGQPYRTPGKFITIKTDNVDINSQENKNLSEVDGHWFVISISHVFENDVYFNDFICVKIYNPAGKSPKNTSPPKAPNVYSGVLGSSSDSSSGINTSGGNKSRGAVNGGGGFPALPPATDSAGAAGGSVSNQAFSEQLKRSDRLQYLEQNSAESLKFFDSFEFGGSAEVSRVEIMNDIALGDYNKALQTFNTIPGFAQRAFDARVNNYFTSSGGDGVLPPLDRRDSNTLPPLD